VYSLLRSLLLWLRGGRLSTRSCSRSMADVEGIEGSTVEKYCIDRCRRDDTI
jgi:hypothetical protein